jgi:transposase-like protein
MIPEKVWQERFEKAQAQGQTAVELARECGVTPSTVHYWKRRLRRDPGVPIKRRVAFAKVERPGVEAREFKQGLEIAFGRVRIQIQRLEDIDLLVNLLLRLNGGAS